MSEIKTLETDFTTETQEYNKAKEQIKIIKELGLKQWEYQSFFKGSKPTDIHKAVKELRNIISSYERKWKNGAEKALKMALSDYEGLRIKWKKESKNLQNIKKGALTVSSFSN